MRTTLPLAWHGTFFSSFFLMSTFDAHTTPSTKILNPFQHWLLHLSEIVNSFTDVMSSRSMRSTSHHGLVSFSVSVQLPEFHQLASLPSRATVESAPGGLDCLAGLLERSSQVVLTFEKYSCSLQGDVGHRL